MQLMKAFVHIDSTELVCLMWGGLAAHGCGWKRAPSVPCLKHAGLGIWSEPAWLTGALFCSAHTCPFCLFFFPPRRPPSPHQLLLEEYANSDPKLALTGVPIVQWPKRDKVGAARRGMGGCCWRVPRAAWPITCCAAGAQRCRLCTSLGSPWAVGERGRARGSAASAALWAAPCARSCRGLQLCWCRGQPRLLCIL